MPHCPTAAVADPSTDDLNQLRAEIQKEIAALKKQEAKLHQQFLDLDRKSQLLDQKSVLLDEQLRTLRATGIGSAGAAPVGVGAPGSTATITSSPTVAAPAPPAAHRSRPVARRGTIRPGARRPTFAAACRGRIGADPGPLGGTAAGPASRRDRADFIDRRRRPDPKGADRSRSVDRIRLLVAEPARGQRLPNHPRHYLWQHLCQPRRAEHHHRGADRALWHNRPAGRSTSKSPIFTIAVSTISLIPVGTTAELLTLNATGTGIGDIQFGSSYQFNSGENGWPIFIGNVLFKTATGISPFDVPIVTVNDPNGEFLEGSPKRLATGTGFYAIEPSLTILMPTAPGVLFANIAGHPQSRPNGRHPKRRGRPRDARLPAAWRKPGDYLRHRLFAERPCGDDLQLPATARVYRLRKPSGDLRVRPIRSAPSISVSATRSRSRPG